MKTVFRYTLRNLRGGIWGWGIGLALLSILLVSMYEPFASQAEYLNALKDIYPKELMAFFGDIEKFLTPEGFLSIEFFSYMPLVLGIFAILTGSGLLVSDEENGTLDLILAYPISRSALFGGRWLAFLSATLIILAFCWLGLVIPMQWIEIDLTWAEIALPMVALGVQLLLFGNLALFLSLVLPSRRMAAMTSGMLLVASFFITGFAKLNEDLEPISRLSPLNYYQPQEAFHGLNGAWMLGLGAAAMVFSLLAFWLFQRRDIRVGGEGGWRLSWRRK